MKQAIPVFILATLAGCSAGVGLADRTMTAESVEAEVLRNAGQVRTLTGSGTLSVETPEIAQSVAFELTMRKPDSVMIRVEGPFGIDLGLALVTSREFLFYNSMSNELLAGPTNSANLGRILRVGLEFEDLLNLFSGGEFFREDRGAPAAFAIEEEEYVLTFRTPTGARRYRIEPRSFQIVGIDHLDGDGTLFLEQSFGNFVIIDGITLPQIVRITSRQERRRLSLAYSDFSVNPPSLQFNFDVPADAERARVE
ncbi:MAG TPA: DUF4292 domain-containing protein [Bacteroidota bacterium]